MKITLEIGATASCPLDLLVGGKVVGYIFPEHVKRLKAALLSREARRRAKNRAAGLCSCGRPKTKGGRCARCYRAHAAYMRAYMARKNTLTTKGTKETKQP